MEWTRQQKRTVARAASCTTHGHMGEGDSQMALFEEGEAHEPEEEHLDLSSLDPSHQKRKEKKRKKSHQHANR